ncbi:hypothetical protein VCR29J2_980032 [Vibrio coralliirubri]|nr:hypothetical protein VCR29J2_980032 [Vibrio coralliirubri]
MSAAQPVIKCLDYLGLIAAFCHEIGLPGIIIASSPNIRIITSHMATLS